MNPPLPYEIWQCVAAFIPDRQLPSLISVNKAFYDKAMDSKYREVHWTMADKNMIKSLLRLRTPETAGRVRRLHVRAWFIEYLIQKEWLESTLPLPAARWTRFSWFPFPRNLRVEVATVGGNSKSIKAHEILESMTAAVSLMTYVTEYRFEWRDLPRRSDTLRFLTAARTAFGVSLRKLTIHAQLGNFANQFSTVDFNNLEELELHFDYRVEEDSTELLRGTIAAFVNHFRRSLQSLLIASSSKADLSPLLSSLQEFPCLRTFRGHFAFDTVHLADPRGLVKVLRASSDTLLDVELATAFAAVSDALPNPPSTWLALSSALAADLSVLRNLQTLKIPFLSTFDSTRVCLRRSADTLTRLCLVDHFLGKSELVELVQLFAHRPFDSGLSVLHVGLSYFSAEVLDLLSSRLPGLSTLNLVFSPDVPIGLQQTAIPISFRIALRGRQYPDWNLSDLGAFHLFHPTGGNILTGIIKCRDLGETVQHFSDRHCRGDAADGTHWEVHP
ncbi:hypothetical protein DFH07DRAFT_801344 [Mycena maculata]|uniref:F-box domain-containing protein n=1 Tax=Mycena maculata TaxID=230809 RepID=A0AAD7JZC6_9AGAR|nr:hypothetical protein DFH07DRAFT_801344 [Mycena maculata]